jgi:hypothetical protein
MLTSGSFKKGHKSYQGFAEKSSNWKGDKASYSSIHLWLYNNYGKPKKCEGKNCRGNSKNIDYALIKGKKHQHKRENYLTLCKSCHALYDDWGKKLPHGKMGELRKKDIIRKRDNNTCRKCGKIWIEGKRHFGVRHIYNYDELYNNFEKEKNNIITLCHKCIMNLPEISSILSNGQIKRHK